jgi:hypothetical protein
LDGAAVLVVQDHGEDVLATVRTPATENRHQFRRSASDCPLEACGRGKRIRGYHTEGAELALQREQAARMSKSPEIEGLQQVRTKPTCSGVDVAEVDGHD